MANTRRTARGVEVGVWLGGPEARDLLRLAEMAEQQKPSPGDWQAILFARRLAAHVTKHTGGVRS